MRITAEKLLRACRTAAKAIEKSPIEGLSRLSLVHSGESFSATGAGTESYITARCRVSEPGERFSLLVGPKRLLELLRHLEGMIELTEGDGVLRISWQDKTYRLDAWADTLPVEEPDAEGDFAVLTEEAVGLLGYAMGATDFSGLVIETGCVHVLASGSLLATDSFHMITGPFHKPLREVSIPKSALSRIRHCVTAGAEVSYSLNHARFYSSSDGLEVRAYCRLQEVRVPNIKPVLDAPVDDVMVVGPGIRDALRRISVLSDKTTQNVLLDFTPGMLYLRVVQIGTAQSGEEPVALSLCEEPVRMCFNLPRLIRVLGAGQEEVTLEIAGGGQRALVRQGEVVGVISAVNDEWMRAFGVEAGAYAA